MTSFPICTHVEVLPVPEFDGTSRGRGYIDTMVAFRELRGEEARLRMGIDPVEMPARKH